jgi:hypothetical protein
MGEANRKRRLKSDKVDTPTSEDYFRGVIDMRMLPAVEGLTIRRIRALTGQEIAPEEFAPDDTALVLWAFAAVAGDRKFNVGFCIGDGERFTPIGLGVIERMMMEAPGATLHIVPIVHEDIAWDVVLRHLRSFNEKVLLFAFRDHDVYDAGTAEMAYTDSIRRFGHDGSLMAKGTAKQRRQIRLQKAQILNRPPPPILYAAAGVEQEDSPWIFKMVTPGGKTLRTAVWNGRRNYEHEYPIEIIRWVGGDRIAIVQVDSPVGVNLRSSVELTNRLSKDHDGVIHWARDTETFQSIVKSFVRLNFESVSSPELPEDWQPSRITMMGANPQSEKF